MFIYLVCENLVLAVLEFTMLMKLASNTKIIMSHPPLQVLG